MATAGVKMEKRCCHFFSAVFYPILFILAGNDDMHESSRSSKFGQIRQLTAELAAFEHLQKSPYTAANSKWSLFKLIFPDQELIKLK